MNFSINHSKSLAHEQTMHIRDLFWKFFLMFICSFIPFHFNLKKNSYRRWCGVCSVEFSFKDSENLNTEKDYYNDLPGKLPPEMLDPVEDIPPRSQPPKKLTIQVWPSNWAHVFSFNHFSYTWFLSFPLSLTNELVYLFVIFVWGRTHTYIQKPRDRFSSNLIDLNSPPPDPNYVNDKSFDVNSNTTPPAITRDVFDMRKFFAHTPIQTENKNRNQYL